MAIKIIRKQQGMAREKGAISNSSSTILPNRLQGINPTPTVPDTTGGSGMGPPPQSPAVVAAGGLKARNGSDNDVVRKSDQNANIKG